MVFHKSFRDAVLKVKDNGAVNETTVSVAEGDLTFRASQEVNEIKDRGVLHEVKSGDEQSVEVSWSYKLESFVAAASVTAYEAVTNTGGASAWVGTRSATNVYCVDVFWELLDKDASVEETVELSDFYYQNIETAEGDPTSMVSVSGRSFATLPTIT